MSKNERRDRKIPTLALRWLPTSPGAPTLSPFSSLRPDRLRRVPLLHRPPTRLPHPAAARGDRPSPPARPSLASPARPATAAAPTAFKEERSIFLMELSTPQALRVSDADLGVYVHPSNSKRIQQALCRQLSIALFTFNETFDGVLLAYSLGLPKKTAKILPGLIPYFCVTVKAKLLLFSPKPDMLLEGKVIKLSKESIYVIILGFCAAAITSEDIREEFNYKIKDGVGIFSSIYHKRHVIKPGTMLRFSVKSFDEEMLHISGSLIPPGTGCVPWLAKHGIAEGLKVDRSVKKQSKRGREMEMEQDLDLLNEGDLSLSPGVQNKFRRTT